MLMKAAAGLAAVLAVLAGAVATRPADFNVKRSATIQAPADVVFENIHDFNKWNAWNPYYRLDTAQKVTVGGPGAGVGATYSYESEKVGKGRMTITNETAPETVGIKLEFLAPMEATNQATYSIKPAAGGGVDVTWAMAGTNGFMGKAFSMVVDMDTMVGKDFESGLANLKQIAESQAKERAAANQAAAAPAPAAAAAP